jgi:hypothetical protein
MTAPPTAEPQYDSLLQLVTRRLYWFFIGPMFLVLMLLGILNDEQQRLVVFNAAYIVALALLPFSRWLDIHAGTGETADGQPATWSHWWRYTFGVIGVGLALLAAANAWVLLR